MEKLLTIVLMIGLLAIEAAIAAPAISPSQNLNVQVVKEQLELSKKSFQSLQIEKLSDESYVVQVELTPEAASQMYKMTSENIDHTINIVWKNHILTTTTIRSALSSKFLITGFDETQANVFVQRMQASE